MSRDRATNDELAGMHGVLTDHFLDVLKNGEEVTSTNRETGEVKVIRVKPSAAMLNQIRTFLKDNDMKSMPGRNPKLVNLAESLPTFEDDPDQPVTH
jgi:hypothetical protein